MCISEFILAIICFCVSGTLFAIGIPMCLGVDVPHSLRKRTLVKRLLR